MATRYFHWSSVFDCVMHETDESGNTLVNYTHEPSQYGPLLSENRGGTEYYHHYDALGSTTMLTDDSGAVTDRFQYDACGNEVARTGTTNTPYRWVGRWGYQYDQLTGGYYIRARTYQPAVARWMSVDPLSIERWSALLVSYLYGSNTPSRLIDPTGWQAVATGINGLTSFAALMTAFAPPQPPPVVRQGAVAGYLNSVSKLEDSQVGFKLKWTFAIQVANIPDTAHQLWQLNTIAWIEIDGRSCKLESHGPGFLKDVVPLPNLEKKPCSLTQTIKELSRLVLTTACMSKLAQCLLASTSGERISRKDNL